MTDSTNPTLTALATLASQTPSIQYIPPSSPDFDQLRTIYAHPEITPLAILRPTTEPALASTISFLARNQIDFTIRAGGHDMHGRSTKTDTVVVDLRLLNTVRVDPSSSTATIAGGALIRDVIATLQSAGYITPIGSIASVGYAGWAMYGGYGAYSSRFGLGVDQIVGARVVTVTGETITADKDLLKAIRGAGGAFGVLAEVTVKVYKLDRILAGIVVFDSGDLPGVIRKFEEGYRTLSSEGQGLPAALGIHQVVLNFPTATFGVLVLWADEDIKAGEAWVDKICALGPVASRTVTGTTPLAWLDEQSKLVAQSTQGRMWTVNLRRITDEVARVIGDFTGNGRFPADPHVLFDIHELRAGSPSVGSETRAGAGAGKDSVFNARDPHFVIEICPTVSYQVKLKGAMTWGREFCDALKATDRGNILDASYVSFLAEDEFDHERVYGEDLGFLRDVKGRLDPGNVFRNAISYL
ncbi:FAD-binding domain-containing protein [Aspergillus carlsbadensis]|nr:FAD-binding domain-containing protein [Aspergillus carlsbadensis]